VNSARFLGIILDYRLNGKEHLNFIIRKGNQIANVITSLTGTRWGAHPYLLLSLYRSVFRSSIEYGAQIFNLNNNRALFLKLQRQQYRMIRGALGLRQSTPINVLLCEAREPPLKTRFYYLTSKYVMKCLARNSNLVTRSIRRLSIRAQTQMEKIYLIKNVPVFKPYLYLNCETDSIFRSVLPPSLGYDFSATIPIPPYLSFDLSPKKSRGKKRCLYSATEVRQKFKEFASPIIEQAISLYTDGSKRDDDSSVGAAVYSRDLGLSLKHKLPANTSIFTAEAWAVYQSLIMVESSGERKAVIFSDSKSVLEALTSCSAKSHSNYIIPLIKSKFHSLTKSGFSIRTVWVPSHIGIDGNEMADAAAGRAALHGRKPKFRIPFTDFYSRQRHLKDKFYAFLENEFNQMYSVLLLLHPSFLLYQTLVFPSTSSKKSDSHFLQASLKSL